MAIIEFKKEKNSMKGYIDGKEYCTLSAEGLFNPRYVMNLSNNQEYYYKTTSWWRQRGAVYQGNEVLFNCETRKWKWEIDNIKEGKTYRAEIASRGALWVNFNMVDKERVLIFNAEVKYTSFWGEVIGSKMETTKTYGEIKNNNLLPCTLIQIFRAQKRRTQFSFLHIILVPVFIELLKFWFK